MTRRRRGELLLHPIVLAALVVWAVNDHVFKQAHPGLVTGKLSDVAGVIVTPVILLGIYELRPGGRRASAPVVVSCIAFVAVVFSCVELVPAATDLYEHAFGVARWPFDTVVALRGGDGLAVPRRVQLWADAPDLLTLPFLALPLVLGLRAAKSVEVAPPTGFEPVLPA